MGSLRKRPSRPRKCGPSALDSVIRKEANSMAIVSEKTSRLVRGLHKSSIAVMTVLFLVICLSPHIGRLLEPSLFSDDVTRIAELQTTPLSSLILRPFNEHVAPLFDVVSWVTWQL